MSLSFTIRDLPDIPKAVDWTKSMIEKGLSAPERGPVVITMGREKRTLSQNDKIHPMIRDIAKQAKHDQLKTETQWRLFLVACFTGQMLVPNMDNTGFIAVANRGTSDLRKDECSEFIEFLYAAGTDWGVVWSEDSTSALEWARGGK